MIVYRTIYLQNLKQVNNADDSASNTTVGSDSIQWNTVHEYEDNLKVLDINLPAEFDKPSISISSLVVQNCTDITFGNKTIYNGPTIVNHLGIGKSTKSCRGKALLFLKQRKVLATVAIAVSITVSLAALLTILLTSYIPKEEPSYSEVFNIDADHTELTLITRDQWGAVPPTAKIDDSITPVPLVIIQHTVQPACYSMETCAPLVRQAQLIHIYDSDIEEDIGYNFLVGGDGAAYEGRGWDKVGAHARGFNTRSMGVAFIGDFRQIEPPKQQVIAMLKLIRDGVDMKKIAENYTLLGALQVKSTESPGTKLYKILTHLPHYSDDISWLIEYNNTEISTESP